MLSELNSQVPIESGKDTGRSGHRKKWTSNYLTQWCQRFWGEARQPPACLPPSSISLPNRDMNSGWNMMPVHIFTVDYSRFEKPRSYLEPNSPTKGSACLSQQEKLNAKIIRDNIKWLLPVNSRTTCTASRAAWLIDLVGLLAIKIKHTQQVVFLEFNRVNVTCYPTSSTLWLPQGLI